MIESAIPMPTDRSSYPFGDMDPGDSVFFEGQNSQGKAVKAAAAHGRYHGKKFASRSVEGGVRIWRIS